MKRIPLILLIVPLLVLAACEPRTDTENFAASDTAGVDMSEQMQRQEMQAWLDDIDRNMEDLQARAQQTSEDHADDLADLRDRRGEIRNDLQATGDRTSGATTNFANLRSRLQSLDSDVEEFRLKTIDGRDEFVAEVRTRINEIDSDLESLTRRSSMDGARGLDDTRSMDGTRAADGTRATDGTRPGTDQSAQHDQPLARDREAPPVGNDAAGIDRPRTEGMTGEPFYADADVHSLNDDRDDIEEQLQELETESAEDFESSRDDIAESIADLRARVQSARIDMSNGTTHPYPPTSMPQPGTASLE